MTKTDKPHRKTVLITGASVGIGYELARVFGRASYDMVLVSRNKEKLEAVASEIEGEYGVRANVLAKDLAKPGTPQTVFDELEKNDLPIDILVNNAGMGTHGPFHATDIDKQLDMIQLNVTALVHLTRLFLPQMVERRAGKVLNLASTAALQPGPFMAVYYASKAFVVSFSHAIAYELRDTGVTVTAFCPGPTRTEFHKRADMEHIKFFGGSMAMDARTVATAAYQALMDGKKISIPGVKNKVLAAGAYYTPKVLTSRIVSSLNSSR